MIKVFRNKMNGSYIIWSDNAKCTYYDYTQTESIRKFKKDNNIKGKIKKVDFCPFVMF
jgi:hypothetical protein